MTTVNTKTRLAIAATILCLGCRQPFTIPQASTVTLAQSIDAGPFSFNLPSDCEEIPTSPYDSYVRRFTNQVMDLSFDFGDSSNDFSGWPEDTQYENLTIDGKEATLGYVRHDFGHAFLFNAQVHFPKTPTYDAALSMLASCKSPAELAVAKQIFQTIAFRKGNTEQGL